MRELEQHYRPLINELDDLIAGLGDREREVIGRFLEAVVRLTRDEAEALERVTANQKHQAPPEAYPGLWA